MNRLQEERKMRKSMRKKMKFKQNRKQSAKIIALYLFIQFIFVIIIFSFLYTISYTPFPSEENTKTYTGILESIEKQGSFRTFDKKLLLLKFNDDNYFYIDGNALDWYLDYEGLESAYNTNQVLTIKYNNQLVYFDAKEIVEISNSTNVYLSLQNSVNAIIINRACVIGLTVFILLLDLYFTIPVLKRKINKNWNRIIKFEDNYG